MATEAQKKEDFSAIHKRILELVEFMMPMKMLPHESRYCMDLAVAIERYETAEFPQFNDEKVSKNV